MKEKIFVIVFAVVAVLCVVNTILLSIGLYDLKSLNNRYEMLESGNNQLRSMIMTTNGNVNSMRSAISSLEDTIVEPLKLVRTADYNVMVQDMEKASVKVTLTFNEQTENQEFFIVLNNETTGDRTRFALEHSEIGYSRKLELMTSDNYNYQVITKLGDKETYSDRYHIPFSLYGIESFSLKADAYLDKTSNKRKVTYNFFFSIDNRFGYTKNKIESAKVLVYKKGELFETLDYFHNEEIFENGELAKSENIYEYFGSGTQRFYCDKDEVEDYSFVLEVGYGFGEKITQEIDVEYHL